MKGITLYTYRIYTNSPIASHVITVTRDGRVLVDGNPENRDDVARYLVAVRADSRYDLLRSV
jgi:hypothetical protein